MTMEIIECEQGSEEWFMHRLGIPTASMFKTVMASGRDDKDSKTRAKYLRQLAGEIYTGVPRKTYTNDAMERGTAMEEEARNSYAFVHGSELRLVGFIRDGRKGCSPDALIGDRGMLEIKTQQPDLLIDRLLGNNMSLSEHLAQVQGNLWIAQREWIDLSVYWPGLPEFKRRFRRDESHIKRLELGVSVFLEELDAIVDKIKRYGDPETTVLGA